MLLVSAPGTNKLGAARAIAEGCWQAENVELVSLTALTTPNELMGVRVNHYKPLGAFMPVTEALIHCDLGRKACLILSGVDSLADETASELADYLTANPKEGLLVLCLSHGAKPIPSPLYQYITTSSLLCPLT